ncbi:MAG: sensor histidine kinase [Lachnospiraceae bacterium]|nr:sensor histidine kinase [Lachnospiraceae bacterium]
MGIRKTSSIVWKINAYIQNDRLWSMMFQDILLLGVGVVSWCAAAERQYGPIEVERVRNIVYVDSAGWWDRLISVGYTFVPAGATEKVTVSVGAFLQYALPVIVTLFGFQVLGWLLGWMKHSRQLRRYMRPIDDAALTAERISAQGIDEQQIQNLEDAIDQISLSEASVHIGDKDLMGLENAINNLLKRLQESYREQTRFVDDASHELRTPIAVIQGYASMLERWGMNDRTTLEESVHAIREEADHMKTLVDQLLFLARGDRGRQQFTLAPVDISEMLKEIREESEMIDETHRYVLKAEPGLRAYGDAAMLKQAVRILMENAAKYTPAGGLITLKLETARSRNEIGISVQDEGIGLEAEEAAHMFERFFRGEDARGSTKGSGLGLAIAKWIVDRHGGRIEVLSYKGVGTRMTIWIPWHASALQ